jgi:transcriptional regulator with XRE-family HTH domain
MAPSGSSWKFKAVNVLLIDTVQKEKSPMSPVNVGERIRQLRLDSGMSVRALATKTGFSPSLISQVEHSQVTPSIGSLERIAMALGVSLGKFFAEPEPSTVGLVRASARQTLTSTWSPVSVEALAPLDGSGMLEPVMITMAPGGRSGKYPAAPGGEKFALIFAGEVTLTLGDEVHVLRHGDAITFTPATEHQWDNTGAGPAQVVIVTRRVLP